MGFVEPRGSACSPENRPRCTASEVAKYGHEVALHSFNGDRLATHRRARVFPASSRLLAFILQEWCQRLRRKSARSDRTARFSTPFLHIKSVRRLHPVKSGNDLTIHPLRERHVHTHPVADTIRHARQPGYIARGTARKASSASSSVPRRTPSSAQRPGCQREYPEEHHLQEPARFWYASMLLANP